MNKTSYRTVHSLRVQAHGFLVNSYPDRLVPRSACTREVHSYQQWRSQLVTSHLVTSWLFNNYWRKLVHKHIPYYIKIHVFKSIYLYSRTSICRSLEYLFSFYALNVQLDGQKMLFCVLISGHIFKCIVWFYNVIIIVEKNIYKRCGFFFAERDNRCRTTFIDIYKMLQIILSILNGVYLFYYL